MGLASQKPAAYKPRRAATESAPACPAHAHLHLGARGDADLGTPTDSHPPTLTRHSDIPTRKSEVTAPLTPYDPATVLYSRL